MSLIINVAGNSLLTDIGEVKLKASFLPLQERRFFVRHLLFNNQHGNVGILDNIVAHAAENQFL
jgi:hypothetical protein